MPSNLEVTFAPPARFTDRRQLHVRYRYGFGRFRLPEAEGKC